jgi:putative membrane protein
MGKTLVLCVDRDNDFGTKAGVASPIIGRRQNLRAAVKLVLADPEESDANSLFAAIKIHDELREKGEPVEVATVCGDPNVGDKSDHIISYQLGEIVSKVQPESAIVVSDGPEDEFVMPILKAKLKVREVRRVVVRQSERIEDTIYIIRKGLAKEQIQKGIIVPVSLILVIWGIFAITGFYTPQNLGFGILAFAAGLFFLLSALQIRERVEDTFSELRAGMLAARLSIFTSLIAFLILFVGAAYIYQGTVTAGIPTSEEASLYFASGFLWWIIPAIILRWGGLFADFWLRHKQRVWAYVYLTMTGVAMIFLLSAALVLVRYFLGYLHGVTADRMLQEVLVYVAFTIGIAAGAAALYRYVRVKPRPETSGIPAGTIQH